MLLGRFLSGLSAGIFTGTATATLVDLAPGGDRDRASLVATVVNMGGLGLGPPLAGAFAEFLPDPIRLVFVAHLALLAVAALGLRSIAEPTDATGRFAIRPQSLRGAARGAGRVRPRQRGRVRRLRGRRPVHRRGARLPGPGAGRVQLLRDRAGGAVPVRRVDRRPGAAPARRRPRGAGRRLRHADRGDGDPGHEPPGGVGGADGRWPRSSAARARD